MLDGIQIFISCSFGIFFAKGKPPAGGRNLLGPHRLSALSGIRVRNVISGPHANHSIIITEEGKAMSWGEFLNL